MHEFDCIVIGGGIVGLATAWAILERKPDFRIAVIGKEDGWARHQTGRNSVVIHSGIYYKPGSLKAKLCREGNRRLVEFCEHHRIRFEACGKVIVATKPSEIPPMERLFERGVANGLAVRRLAAPQVLELEPHVRCLAGLHVPSTGIVDYACVSRKLAELIATRGGELRLGTKVLGFHANGDKVLLETSKDPLSTRWVINCAGLHSDRVAKLARANPGARIVPFRGEYYELKQERRRLVTNLIYPVPDPQEGYRRPSFNLRDFMDTMSYAGFWRLAGKYARSGLEEMHRSISKKAFVRKLQNLIPEVTEEDLVPGESGVRAQALRPDGGLVDDFLIVNGPCTIHVCNAPSPAATASLEIGRFIADQIPGREVTRT
jgi:L-2-hydroxyglutarate oxidase